MKDLTEINVIEDSYKSELKERNSRFISLAIPVEKQEEAFSNLERIKKEFYDASHHCYAFKFQDNYKYSDAGEPSGTAGIRILNAIEHFNLVNILVVIVRYFGGTKLGVGGLGKTYYNSALKVLEKAEIKKKYLYQKILIKLDIHFAQKVYHIFNEPDKKMLKAEFPGKAEFECAIRPENLSQIQKMFQDLTNGNVEISLDKKIYL